MGRGTYLLAVLLSLAAGSAYAGDALSSNTGNLIERAVAAYTVLDYDHALPLLAEAEKQPNLSTADHVTILKYRAFIQILQGKEILARDAVAGIFGLDPGFSLPTTVSPKFRNFFADVRKDIKPQVVETKPSVSEALPPAQTVAAGGPERPNLLMRFWPSWTCLAAGVGFLIPGMVIGLDATSGRDELKNAQKDSAGRLAGMTYEDAKKLQDDADRKGLTADILLGVGATALVTGAAMFFVYDGAKDTAPKSSVSFESNGDKKLLKAAWAF